MMLEELKRLLVAGVLVLLLLAVLVGVLKLTFVLIGILVPVAFVAGAVYLGYRWWQDRLGRREREGRSRSRW